MPISVKNSSKTGRRFFWSPLEILHIQDTVVRFRYKLDCMRLVAFLNWQRRDPMMADGITQTQDYQANEIGISVRTLQRWYAILRQCAIVDIFPNYQIIDGLPHRMANTIVLTPFKDRTDAEFERTVAAAMKAQNAFTIERAIYKKQWRNRPMSVTHGGVNHESFNKKEEFTTAERRHIEERLRIGEALWATGAFAKR